MQRMGRNSSKVLDEIFTLGLKLRIQGVLQAERGGKAFQAKGTACIEAQRHGIFRKLLVV